MKLMLRDHFQSGNEKKLQFLKISRLNHMLSHVGSIFMHRAEDKLAFRMFTGSRDFPVGGRLLAGLFVVGRFLSGEAPFLRGLTAFFLL